MLSLWDIVGRTLQVSLTAVAIATIIALPLAALLVTRRFFGHQAIVTVINTLMGLPPVIVGLLVFLLLSSRGPLAVLDLLYTPTAMVIAQCLLVTPIIAGVAYELLLQRYHAVKGLLLTYRRAIWFDAATLLFDARFALLTAIMTGLGRAFAEVGAVMIVGGNIAGETRVLTTAIVLENSRGQYEIAMALGGILLCLALTINVILMLLRAKRTQQTLL